MKNIKEEKYGFAKRFKKHLEFYNEKHILLEYIVNGIREAKISGNTTLVNVLNKEATEILNVIKSVEKKFTTRDGKTLNQLVKLTDAYFKKNKI